MRLRTAFAALSILSLSAACTREAEAPPEPAQPSPAPAAPSAATAISYACESGQSIAVAYPDASSARVTYGGRTYTLRSVQAASGARYAGAGLEWWTATRGGTESATLGRLGPDQNIGATTLERCSRPASSPVAPGPAPTPAPGGVAPAAAPCKGPQLRLSNDGGDAGMGHRRAIIGVQNVGAGACSLTGYPSVTLQDARGNALTSVRTDQHAGSWFRSGEAPTPVELAPRAKAFFDMAWTVIPHEDKGERVCPSAARIRMTPPEDSSPVTLAQTFTPCGGRIEVSPFRPVAEPAPVPAG